MPSNRPTPILFLDLDGTVRKGPKELGRFVNGPEDVELFDGMVELIKSYKARGWRIVAISNQGGIALGDVTANSVNRAMEETNRLCARLFDRMYWCTHHPDAVADEYASKEEKSICLCRKPMIGYVVVAMASMAEQYDEFYRPYTSLFVGDMEDDKQCAANANIPFKWSDTWREKGPLTD